MRRSKTAKKVSAETVTAPPVRGNTQSADGGPEAGSTSTSTPPTSGPPLHARRDQLAFEVRQALGQRFGSTFPVAGYSSTWGSKHDRPDWEAIAEVAAAAMLRA